MPPEPPPPKQPANGATRKRKARTTVTQRDMGIVAGLWVSLFCNSSVTPCELTPYRPFHHKPPKKKVRPWKRARCRTPMWTRCGPSTNKGYRGRGKFQDRSWPIYWTCLFFPSEHFLRMDWLGLSFACCPGRPTGASIMRGSTNALMRSSTSIE